MLTLCCSRVSYIDVFAFVCVCIRYTYAKEYVSFHITPKLSLEEQLQFGVTISFAYENALPFSNAILCPTEDNYMG